MTTKDHCLFFKDKQQNFIVNDDFNGQFNNLNLNQNNQHLLETVQSKNVKNHNKAISNYVKNLRSRNFCHVLTSFFKRSAILTTSLDYNNDSQTKQNFTSFFGKSKLSSSFANPNIQNNYGKKDKSKDGKILNANNSTLSLHITAYENSIEAIGGDRSDGEKDETNKKTTKISSLKSWKSVKQFYNDSSSSVNYTFELPRQQQDQKLDPEVMQFLASQQLSNVNQPLPAVFVPQMQLPPASVNPAPSSSNSSFQSEFERTFAEIMKSWNEYSTQNINDFESAKAEILKDLKTHRPVKLCDFEYGLSQNLVKNHRIIVKEPEDGSKVREYNAKFLTCTNKSVKHVKCKSSFVKCKYGILFVPIKHGDGCEAKHYSIVKEIQNLRKKGNKNEAQKLSINYTKFIRNPLNQSSSSSSMLNEPSLSGSDQDVNSFIERLLSEEQSAGQEADDEEDDDRMIIDEPSPPKNNALNQSSSSTSMIDQPPSTNADDKENIIIQRLLSEHSTTVTIGLNSSTPSLTEAAENVAEQSVKQEIDEEGDECMISDEPAAKKPKVKESKINETFQFRRPSEFVLQKICKNLKIDYNQDAYKLWGEIGFQNIPSIANNIQTHTIEAQNIFACLCLLFTGQLESFSLVEHAINKAFREDPSVLAVFSRSQINQMLVKKSDEQIEFITKFLGCRIGIYYGKVLKKFGKWNHQEDEEEVLTLILSCDGGSFSVVLNLQ